MSSEDIPQARITGSRLRDWVGSAALVFLLVAAICPRSGAQDSPSGLAAENLGNVAASAAGIEVILRKDEGVFIELKRWVAKDGADHGQIVRDSELEDVAIYLRLESDIKFRSVATTLLQRYGYLLPQVNPDSALGKEQELLIEERVKWLAQHQEMARQKAAEQAGRRLPCDPQLNAGCSDRMPSNPQGQRTEWKVGVAPEQRDSLDSDEMQDLPFPVPAPESQPPQSPGRVPQYVQSGEEIGIGASASSLLPQTPGATQAPGNPAEGTEMTALTGSEESLISGDRLVGMTKKADLALGTPMVREPHPYGNIPSLYDLYLQATPRPPEPTRFGLDVFDHPSHFAQKLPMDLPVGPEYVVGPGDGLAVDLWGGVSRRLVRTVDPEGRLALPEVGPVLVSGKTLADVQESMQKVLRTQFRDLSVSVSLARLRTVRVYVVGDVDHPGAYDISSLSTPLNALFAAGGPTARGSLRDVKHMRGDQMVEEVDVYGLLLHGLKANLQRLENGDTVIVPPLGKQVTVEGMVRRPAFYELRNEKNLAEVLELAGGILPSAALGHIEVQRTVAHDRRTMLSLDIPQAQDVAGIIKQLESFAIQDGDAVNLFPIAPYNQDAVYLAGHVLRPGRYAYRPGMRLTDVVSSYKDLLPEPATAYAEIIRLNAPDYRLSVESFDLADALTNSSASPELKPLDTVRIFSRFDFEDPPVVSVLGDVRRPGTYRATGQIHVRDAIRIAGGLGPDAQTGEAQVFSYLPDSKLRVTSVNLREALNGNPLDNMILRSRDAILIHRNPAKVDPPSVFIEGEVVQPGRYPLVEKMTVADLVRAAGGFKRSANTQSADLTSYLLQDTKSSEGKHFQIQMAAALRGDANSNVLLHDGDVLTVAQLPSWMDVGASVRFSGEVQHPGTYGIRPGDRLSSVLKRAGGFLPTAFPQGVVFERVSVREIQWKSRQELIQRVQLEGATFKTSLQATGQEQVALQQAAVEQRNRVIAALQQAPVTGRMVVRMGTDLKRFENSPDDVELRNGDSIFIPKHPDYVLVTGQVYNSNAITFTPGRDARWYLQQAGGPTDQANKKAIYLVRANGAVVSGQGGAWSGGVLSTQVQAGDVIIVPEKAVGGGTAWKNFVALAQIASAAAITAAVIP